MADRQLRRQAKLNGQNVIDSARHYQSCKIQLTQVQHFECSKDKNWHREMQKRHMIIRLEVIKNVPQQLKCTRSALEKAVCCCCQIRNYMVPEADNRLSAACFIIGCRLHHRLSNVVSYRLSTGDFIIDCCRLHQWLSDSRSEAVVFIIAVRCQIILVICCRISDHRMSVARSFIMGCRLYRWAIGSQII